MLLKLGNIIESKSEKLFDIQERISCNNCGAYFSAISFYDTNNKVWKCDFCGNNSECIISEVFIFV